MKKVLVWLMVAAVLMSTIALNVSAHFTGLDAEDVFDFNVPKINPDNPKIKFDGKVDLDGEWYGAVCSSVDLTTEESADKAGLWDASVWGNSYSTVVDVYEDIPVDQRNRWDVYYLWDEDGLYFALVCNTDKTPCAFNPAFYGVSSESTDGQTRRVDSFTPMIRPDDDENTAYEWFEFWVETTTDEPFWNDDETIYYAGGAVPTDFDIEMATWRSSTPNENGAYPYSMEVFIPWGAICYGNTDSKLFDFTAEAGKVIQIGQIFLDGNGLVDENGDPYDWSRGFDCPGWAHFNRYILSGDVAAASPAAVTETATTTEEAVVKTEPETTAKAEEPVETVDVAAEDTSKINDVVTEAPQTSDYMPFLMIISSAAALLLRKRR